MKLSLSLSLLCLEGMRILVCLHRQKFQKETKTKTNFANIYAAKIFATISNFHFGLCAIKLSRLIEHCIHFPFFPWFSSRVLCSIFFLSPSLPLLDFALLSIGAIKTALKSTQLWLWLWPNGAMFFPLTVAVGKGRRLCQGKLGELRENCGVL